MNRYARQSSALLSVKTFWTILRDSSFRVRHDGAERMAIMAD